MKADRHKRNVLRARETTERTAVTSPNLQFWVDGTMIIDVTDPNSPLEGEGYGLQVDLRTSDAPQAHTGDNLEVRFDDFQVSR